MSDVVANDVPPPLQDVLKFDVYMYDGLDGLEKEGACVLFESLQFRTAIALVIATRCRKNNFDVRMVEALAAFVFELALAKSYKEGWNGAVAISMFMGCRCTSSRRSQTLKHARRMGVCRVSLPNAETWITLDARWRRGRVPASCLEVSVDPRTGELRRDLRFPVSADYVPLAGLGRDRTPSVYYQTVYSQHFHFFGNVVLWNWINHV